MFVGGVSSRLIGWSPNPTEKQLFLSHHVVTETDEFEGGILVDATGVIEAVLKKESVELMLRSERSKNWKVSKFSLIYEYIINKMLLLVCMVSIIHKISK